MPPTYFGNGNSSETGRDSRGFEGFFLYILHTLLFATGAHQNAVDQGFTLNINAEEGRTVVFEPGVTKALLDSNWAGEWVVVVVVVVVTAVSCGVGGGADRQLQLVPWSQA